MVRPQTWPKDAWGWIILSLVLGLIVLLIQRKIEKLQKSERNLTLECKLHLQSLSHFESTQATLYASIERLQEALRLAIKEGQEKSLEAERAQKELECSQQQQQTIEKSLQHALRDFLEQRVEHEKSWQSHQLGHLLLPLKDQIHLFQTTIENYFQQESKERHLLSHELQNLQSMSLKLSSDATQLSDALRGNVKQQGCWGELILEKTLEQSGLRAGIEYQTQVSLQSPEEGKRLQPDALVYLPQKRTVVVDAKVSLTAYLRFLELPEGADQRLALQAHIHSLRSHIRKLHEKHYGRAPQIESLDMVLLFVPVESAFALALKHAPQLIQEAQEQQVMLVTPTTLTLALKTVQQLWRQEYQSRQAKMISKKILSLYEKFQRFVKGCEVMGQALGRAQHEYDQAMNRLCYGKGNLMRQLEQFQSLGADWSSDPKSEMDEAPPALAKDAPMAEQAAPASSVPTLSVDPEVST